MLAAPKLASTADRIPNILAPLRRSLILFWSERTEKVISRQSKVKRNKNEKQASDKKKS